jgi:hypothetical protein
MKLKEPIRTIQFRLGEDIVMAVVWLIVFIMGKYATNDVIHLPDM